MGVGRSPSGEAALMVLATDSPVSPETVAQVIAGARRAVGPRHRPRLDGAGSQRGCWYGHGGSACLLVRRLRLLAMIPG